MGIDEIKRWQWALIGLLVGLGLGWVWSGQESTGAGRLINQIDFERDVVLKHPKTGEPLIKNIVLEPVTTDYRGAKVQPVSFQRLQQGAKTGTTHYMPAQFIAMIPYRPMLNGVRSTNPNYAVADYLSELKKRNAAVQFGYGWYNERPAALAIWTIGSVVLIGGIWPTILNLLTGAGGGVREKKAKKEDYFDRFSHAPEPTTAGPDRSVSDADRQQLEDMNAVLERDLTGTIESGAAAATAEGPDVPVEVRKLQAGPLEVAPVKSAEEEEIEVKGEFYPVLIHHKKHHDDEDGAGDSSKR